MLGGRKKRTSPGISLERDSYRSIRLSMVSSSVGQDSQASTRGDRVYVVHVNVKGKETDNWDKGTAVLGDVQTELAPYDHSITELQGDVVSSIVQFIAQEGIHIVILSLKDQNRVKKTLSMGAANQILSKACCACTIVSPRFSAGDHFRIQAKLQPDALVANSALQFRRRVAVVLNSASWDSALTQYVAKNVILPGDRVVLVRCLLENVNKKSPEEMQIERDYLRELGWHKFKRTNVTLAVEVLKCHTRVVCEFLDEKGIDLLIMARSDSNKLKRSIKKENVPFQTFPHKCPCPFMIVPTEVLRGCGRTRSSLHSDELPSSPGQSTGVTSIFSRKTWSSAFQGPHLRIFGSRRCLSLDSQDPNETLRAIDYIKRDDSIELSSVAIAESESQEPSKTINRAGSTSSYVECGDSGMEEEDAQREAVIRRLERKLSEKEKEVLALKQRLYHLQSI